MKVSDNFMKSDMLRNHLEESIWRKRRGLLPCGLCVQHDIARPHTACHTAKQILVLNLAMLCHPPHSTDLALSDFHFFCALKDAVRGRHIRSDEEVKKAVQDWLSQQPIWRLLQRNLYPFRTLEQECTRQWGLHWRLSLYRIYVCCKSLYNILPIFVRITLFGITREGHNFWNSLLQWSNILKLFQAQSIMCIE
jgi:hypothetical protein